MFWPEWPHVRINHILTTLQFPRVMNLEGDVELYCLYHTDWHSYVRISPDHITAENSVRLMNQIATF